MCVQGADVGLRKPYEHAMDIKVATRNYEPWMHDCGPVVERHLQLKHTKMLEKLGIQALKAPKDFGKNSMDNPRPADRYL